MLYVNEQIRAYGTQAQITSLTIQGKQIPKGGSFTGTSADGNIVFNALISPSVWTYDVNIRQRSDGGLVKFLNSFAGRYGDVITATFTGIGPGMYNATLENQGAILDVWAFDVVSPTPTPSTSTPTPTPTPLPPVAPPSQSALPPSLPLPAPQPPPRPPSSVVVQPPTTVQPFPSTFPVASPSPYSLFPAPSSYDYGYPPGYGVDNPPPVQLPVQVAPQVPPQNQPQLSRPSPLHSQPQPQSPNQSTISIPGITYALPQTNTPITPFDIITEPLQPIFGFFRAIFGLP